MFKDTFKLVPLIIFSVLVTSCSKSSTELKTYNKFVESIDTYD